MLNRVVARYEDGRVIKGTSLDVDPARPLCHVKTDDKGVLEVKLTELKALYFVKDLRGDQAHQEASQLAADDNRLRGSKPIEIRFRDRERLVGLCNRFPPLGAFFFVLPADTKSNNVRILVNRAATTAIGLVGQTTPARR